MTAKIIPCTDSPTLGGRHCPEPIATIPADSPADSPGERLQSAYAYARPGDGPSGATEKRLSQNSGTTECPVVKHHLIGPRRR